MNIIQSIAEVQSILDQCKSEVCGEQEDVDGEGNIPEPCSETTFQKASQLIIEFYEEIIARAIALELPRISLGWGGKIDMHVRAEKYDLLIVIYKEAAKDAVFSVNNYSPKSILGHYPQDKEILFHALQRFIVVNGSSIIHD